MAIKRARAFVSVLEFSDMTNGPRTSARNYLKMSKFKFFTEIRFEFSLKTQKKQSVSTTLTTTKLEKRMAISTHSPD